MTELEYERIAANYLRSHGYSNVTVTKGSGDYGVDVVARKNGKLRIILWLIYIFFASAIAYATYEAIITKPFWTAVYEASVVVLILTSPLWIKALCRSILSQLKRSFSSICTYFQSKNREKIPEQDEENPQGTSINPQVIPEQRLFAHPGKIGNVLADSDFSYISNYEELCYLEHLTASSVQRKLKLGFASAHRLLDILEKAELIETSDTFKYNWTDKAKW